MQQFSPTKNLLNKIGAGFVLLVALATVNSPALAQDPLVIASEWQDFPPTLLLAMIDPPDFLAPAPTGKGEEEERESAGGAAIIPFIGTNKGLTLLPIPERPAIAARDVIPLDRPEVTAGVNVDLGAVNFNLGYTLPSSQVDEFIRPLGVDLEPGTDVKRFSLGVKIPF